MADEVLMPDNSVLLWPDVPPQENFDDGLPAEELADAKKFRPWLEPYLLEGSEPRPAVLIFPGGGYRFRVQQIIEPTTRRFNELGFHCFVCQYRTKPHRHPGAFLDAARALRIIRANAEKWRVISGAIAVLGYSAGGHLAAHLSAKYDSADCEIKDEISQCSCKPDALVACYAPLSHKCPCGSFRNILGEKYSEAEASKICPTQIAHSEMPPAFIWSTAEDQTVPVESSLDFAKALRANKVPFEMHIYPHGPHSLCLAEDYEDAGQWSALAGQWLRRVMQ